MSGNSGKSSSCWRTGDPRFSGLARLPERRNRWVALATFCTGPPTCSLLAKARPQPGLSEGERDDGLQAYFVEGLARNCHVRRAMALATGGFVAGVSQPLRRASTSKRKSLPSPAAGRFVVVTVGIDDYQHWPKLDNAVRERDGSRGASA